MDVPKKVGAKVITRGDFECPIFGHLRDLINSKLPSHEDVLRCCFQERFNLAILNNNKSVSFSKVAGTVANKIKSLYEKASIPTVTDYRVVQLINAYYESYCNLRKSYNRDKNKPAFKVKVEGFKAKASSVFDIAACKCEIIADDCICKRSPDTCVCSISIDCRCEKSKKIPVLELRFMYFQRNYGLGRIGLLDRKETKKNTERIKRKNYKRKRSQSTAPAIPTTVPMPVENCLSDDSYDNDHDFEPQTSTSSQMRVSLKATALTSDRYGVSERATAAIASSILQDIGMINESDTTYVVDKSKVRREKSAVRAELQSRPIKDIYGLYFDGRKDNTSFVEKACGKHFRQTVKEEHYTLIQEPGSIYIGHISPTSSSATDISKTITTYLAQNGISLQKLDVIGCDGTVTNTGRKNGVVRQIESNIGRPLQWSICLLHFNELPLRHLFQHLDGETSGPKLYSGPIGKDLPGCEKLPVVQFANIECDIPEVDRQLLSKDQQYLLDISKAIQSGHCSEDLAIRDPGPLSHSRWLTTANRVLRLFISVNIPSGNMVQLVTFILKSYVPMWFTIKIGKHFTEGPKHVFKTIETTRYLPEELLKVINPVIQRNAYFAHPENLLLAMILDERNHIRELGYMRILKARLLASKNDPIREFVPPKLNFEAKDYTDIINWNTCSLTPPPLLRELTDEEIKLFVSKDSKPILDFKKFPCHTHAVERCVKLQVKSVDEVLEMVSSEPHYYPDH